MKKSTTLFLFILSLTFSFAQSPYFNEWYASDPDRPFVKLLVSEDAVYEVTVADLMAAGHDLSQAQPDSIQLYYRGEEIPLTVERDSLENFASLTFYGRRNDGAVEAQMYRNPITHAPDPSQQPNPDFSLYSDTAAYFLSWGSDVGKRYQTLLDTNYAQYSPEVSYPYEMSWEPHPDSGRNTSNYARAVVGGGNPYSTSHSINCDFGTGEGYVSDIGFGNEAPLRTNFLYTPDPISGMHDVRFQIGLFHRSKTKHHPSVSLAKDPSVVILDTLYPYQIIRVKRYSRTLPLRLSAQTDLIFKDLTFSFEDSPLSHLTTIKIRYQRRPDLKNTGHTQIREWTRNTTTYFQFENPLGQDQLWVYDPENHIRYEGQISGGKAHVLLNGRFYGKSLEMVTDQGFQKPVIAQQTHLRNLCHPDSGVQFVIIAHRKVDTSALAYAAYRDTTTAGHEPLSAKVVFIDEIYDEFSYGAPTPQAIQQFVNCALDNWTVKPKYLFLWGKGKLWLRGSSEPVVPSYGYPANDVRFTTPWGGDRTSQVAIGRLNIYDNREGMAYLEKVKHFERTGEEAWRKEAVMIGRGEFPAQSSTISLSLSEFSSCFASSEASNGNPAIVDDQDSSITNPINYHSKVDSGIGLFFNWIYFSSNLGIFPFLEAFEYQNFDKPTFLMSLGGYWGDWSGRESFGERWIKEPRRGAIALLANASYGFVDSLYPFGQIFFCQQLSLKPNRPLGEIVRHTYQKMVDSLPGFQYLNHARQMNLQGDPALVIFPFGMNTGIPPQPKAFVQVFPNPAHDELTLSSSDEFIEAVSLYNLLGQQVLEKDALFKSKVQLDVSSLKPGYYFLQYRTRKGIGLTKLVVE